MQVLGRGAAAAEAAAAETQPALQAPTPACRPAAVKIWPSRASGRESVEAGLRARGMVWRARGGGLSGRADSGLGSVQRSRSREQSAPSTCGPARLVWLPPPPRRAGRAAAATLMGRLGYSLPGTHVVPAAAMALTCWYLLPEQAAQRAISMGSRQQASCPKLPRSCTLPLAPSAALRSLEDVTCFCCHKFCKHPAGLSLLPVLIPRSF